MVSIDAGIELSAGDNCDNNPPPERSERSDDDKPSEQLNTGQPNKDPTPTPPGHKQAFESPSSPQSSPSSSSSSTPSSSSPTPTNSPNMFFALPSDSTDTLSNGPIPSDSPYAGNADGIMPTAGTNDNTINTINTNDYNSTSYGSSEDTPSAKSIPVLGALFCAAIAGFLLLVFRKKLFRTRAFSRRPIFSVKSFTKSSKDQSSTNHRLYDLDDWSVRSCDKDARKVSIPPVAQMSQMSHKRASTTDLESPIREDGFLRKSLSRLSHDVERSPTPLSQSPFEDEGEFEVLVMPSTPERKVNWEDCMR